MKVPNLSFIASVASITLIIALMSVWMAKPSASATATLPPGSKITVRFTQPLARGQNRPGNQFDATLKDPVLIGGQPVVPMGTKIGGKVVNAGPSVGSQNVAQLRLTLDSIQLGDRAYELYTDDVVLYGSQHSSRTLKFTGGSHAAELRREGNITLPAETVLSFKLIEPLRVPIKK